MKDLNGQNSNQSPEKPISTKQTLWNALHDMFFTVKIIRDCHVDRNRVDVVFHRNCILNG